MYKIPTSTFCKQNKWYTSILLSRNCQNKNNSGNFQNVMKISIQFVSNIKKTKITKLNVKAATLVH